MGDVAHGDASGEKRRVLLKLSGEALMGEAEYGIDPGVVRNIALRHETHPACQRCVVAKSRKTSCIFPVCSPVRIKLVNK